MSFSRVTRAEVHAASPPIGTLWLSLGPALLLGFPAPFPWRHSHLSPWMADLVPKKLTLMDCRTPHVCNVMACAIARTHTHTHTANRAGLQCKAWTQNSGYLTAPGPGQGKFRIIVWKGRKKCEEKKENSLLLLSQGGRSDELNYCGTPSKPSRASNRNHLCPVCCWSSHQFSRFFIRTSPKPESASSTCVYTQ